MLHSFQLKNSNLLLLKLLKPCHQKLLTETIYIFIFIFNFIFVAIIKSTSKQTKFTPDMLNIITNYFNSFKRQRIFDKIIKTT